MEEQVLFNLAIVQKTKQDFAKYDQGLQHCFDGEGKATATNRVHKGARAH